MGITAIPMDGRSVGPLTSAFFAALMGKTAIPMDERAVGPLTDVFYAALRVDNSSDELSQWTV
jgi:hypothetical protein